MKLYHLTPKRLYKKHIRKEGLKLHPVSPDYDPDMPGKALFCWPKYNKRMLRDWIIFNKVKNGNKDDDYILLQVSVPESAILDADCAHSLTAVASGSHGKSTLDLHNYIQMCVVTEPIPPEDITPILEISTYTAEKIE